MKKSYLGNQGARKHLYSPDYIRAIASMAVAVFHLGGKALPVLNYGWLGVEMFFVLSGFIICWSMPPEYHLKTIFRFLLKRLVRIEPPYLISIALLIILDIATKHSHPVDWMNILLHSVYLNGFFNKPFLNPVYWTLGIEFQFYLFIAFFFPVIVKSWGKWLIIILCILPVFVHISGLVLVASFPFFGLGISSFLFKKQKISLVYFLIFVGFTATYLLFTTGLALVLVGLLSVAMIFLPLKSNKAITFFSNISFSLYLTHDIIGSRLVIFLGTIFSGTLFHKGLFFIIGIAVSILSAWLFYILCEKPFFIWSKAIPYKPQKAA